jgi:hypothetical protein
MLYPIVMEPEIAWVQSELLGQYSGRQSGWDKGLRTCFKSPTMGALALKIPLNSS